MTKPELLVCVLALALASLACRDPLPCSDCEAADEESVPDLPAETPDLPCGGADLSSDPNNCGECGHTCGVVAEGTEWQAGGCIDGECAPLWGVCVPHYEEMPKTCAEKCLIGTCQANGCSGHTAVFFTTNPFDPQCWEDDPYAVFDGGCDEPLTAPFDDPDVAIQVECCCS